MALRHPSIGMGFNWRVNLWGAPGVVAHRCDDPVLATGAEMTAKAIGEAEIADLRPVLGNARHPDAGRDAPVWGATHVRAVLEFAWQKLDAIVRRGSRTTLRDTYDMRTMAVWLHQRERTRAAMLGRAMAELSDARPSREEIRGELDAEPRLSWLLRRKVTVPERTAGYMDRAGLVERTMPTRSRLTVLLAPGGFGKTTVLAECCRYRQPRITNMTADAESVDTHSIAAGLER